MLGEVQVVTFTEAIIRGCKHKVSGRHVDFAWLIGEVAMMDAKFVEDSDVRHHFAEAVITRGNAPVSFWRSQLVDLVATSLKQPEVMSRVVSNLAHTRVDDLRQRGLWTEVVS